MYWLLLCQSKIIRVIILMFISIHLISLGFVSSRSAFYSFELYLLISSHQKYFTKHYMRLSQRNCDKWSKNMWYFVFISFCIWIWQGSTVCLMYVIAYIIILTKYIRFHCHAKRVDDLIRSICICAFKSICYLSFCCSSRRL